MLVFAIELIPVLLSLVSGEDLGILLSFFIFISRYIILAIIVILQVVIFCTNLSWGAIHLKFLSALTCVYSLAFMIVYVSRARDVLKFENLLNPLQAANPELFGPQPQNAYIGSHTWFLLPVILQVIIFSLFVMKKNRSSKTVS